MTADIIKQIAIMIYPAMPQTSIKILNLFSIKEDSIKIESLDMNIENIKLGNLKPLFPRVE